MIVPPGTMMKIKWREDVSNVDISVVNNEQCTFLIFGLKWEVSISCLLFDSFYFNFVTNICLYDSNKSNY